MARIVICYRVVFVFARIREDWLHWLGTNHNNRRIEASFKIVHEGNNNGGIDPSGHRPSTYDFGSVRTQKQCMCLSIILIE